jgi:hypothetical protein
VAIAELLNEIPIEPQAALSQEPRYRIRNEEVADEERIVVERDLRNCRNLATKTAWVRIELAENEQERKGPGCRRDRGLPRSAPRPPEETDIPRPDAIGQWSQKPAVPDQQEPDRTRMSSG